MTISIEDYGNIAPELHLLTISRQAMVGAAIIYPASIITAVIKNKNRKATLITFGALVFVGLAVVIWKWNSIMGVLGKVSGNLFGEDDAFDGNGRLPLVKRAVQYFIEYPIFGTGFHVAFPEDAGFVGLDGFIPAMAHNTFAELIGTCGILGLFAYLFHRIQTVIAFTDGKMNICKLYIAFSLSELLILSLFDNHIFYLFPTIIYSSILPFATGKGDRKGKPVPFSKLN